LESRCGILQISILRLESSEWMETRKECLLGVEDQRWPLIPCESDGPSSACDAGFPVVAMQTFQLRRDSCRSGIATKYLIIMTHNSGFCRRSSKPSRLLAPSAFCSCPSRVPMSSMCLASAAEKVPWQSVVGATSGSLTYLAPNQPHQKFGVAKTCPTCTETFNATRPG
jgi:hypothetical protein